MTSGIYKIINVVNNKFYVGSAVNFARRWTNHRQKFRCGKGVNRHLQAAWDKYGEQSFVFVVVEEVDIDKLLEAENRWLKEHVGKEYCYNIGVDAKAAMLGRSGELNPMYGRRFAHTGEAKEKIRRTSLGRKHTQEAKDKIKAYLTGKPKSAETRAKISATLSGDGNFWYGKKRSQEFKAKVNRPVFVMPDGIMFESITQVRQFYGLKPPTINRALQSGKELTRGPFKGYSFKYGGVAAVQTEQDKRLIEAGFRNAVAAPRGDSAQMLR